jgi:2-amino-4-hydroxy-6-hydroxymethyldihydropteridine diphosphokinase
VLAYLSLGANLGDRAATLRAAIEALRRLGDVTAVSSLYETAPVGYRDQPDFLNAAVALRTDFAPDALLEATQAIEQEFGRQRSFPNAPRTLDIDLIYLDDLILTSPHLTIPHPRAVERAFVLIPLHEIAPDFRDPRSGETIAFLTGRLTDRGDVRLYQPSDQ